MLELVKEIDEQIEVGESMEDRIKRIRENLNKINDMMAELKELQKR